ncbi:MAG: quinone oxidoreductase [Hyphomicrobiaceae bacterium]
MVHAVRIHAYGGPEVLTYEQVDVPAPGPGEVRLRQKAAGLNFIDCYQRSGAYKLAALPAVLGMEGAGEVIALGEGVTEVARGDRVAYAMSVGGYAEERNIAAARVVKVPDTIDDATAAAMMLQGMTVRYLFRETFPVTAKTVMLFHAAAGGVGLIACQWARAIGATLIGTVSSDEKAALAMANGATHVINVKTENFVERVREITGGKGCDVVFDGVGKDTFPGSLDCLRPRGLWATFGASSGAIPPIEVGIFSAKGSLYMTRPTLATYIAKREDLVANTTELFEMITSGKVKIAVNQRYPLSAAGDAHRDLEARRTTGSSVFVL